MDRAIAELILWRITDRAHAPTSRESWEALLRLRDTADERLAAWRQLVGEAESHDDPLAWLAWHEELPRSMVEALLAADRATGGL